MFQRLLTYMGIVFSLVPSSRPPAQNFKETYSQNAKLSETCLRQTKIRFGDVVAVACHGLRFHGVVIMFFDSALTGFRCVVDELHAIPSNSLCEWSRTGQYIVVSESMLLGPCMWMRNDSDYDVLPRPEFELL